VAARLTPADIQGGTFGAVSGYVTIAGQAGSLTFQGGTLSAGTGYVLAYGAAGGLEEQQTAQPTLVSDDFLCYAASCALSANWSTVSASGVESPNINGADYAQYTGSATGLAYWSADTFTNDQFAQAYTAYDSDAKTWGPAVRISPTANTFYSTRYDSCVGGEYFCVILTKVVNGVTTDLGVIAPVVDAYEPETFFSTTKITAVGSTISLYLNDVFQGSATDTTIPSGSPGMMFKGPTNAHWLDNFAAGDL